MNNLTFHYPVGILVSIAFGFIALFSGHIFVAALLILLSPVFAIVATVPDVIDPPYSPFHRSIGHSFLAIAILGGFTIGLFITFFIFNYVSFLNFIAGIPLLFSAIAGIYLSHLMADVTSPMRLPIFFGKTILGLLYIPASFIPIVNILLFVVGFVITLIFFITQVLTYTYIIHKLAKKFSGKIIVTVAGLPLWWSSFFGGIIILYFSQGIKDSWVSFLYGISNTVGLILVLMGIVLFLTFLMIGHIIYDRKTRQESKEKTKKRVNSLVD